MSTPALAITSKIAWGEVSIIRVGTATRRRGNSALRTVRMRSS